MTVYLGAGAGRNIVTVPVCSKCGRGFLGKWKKRGGQARDTQPVWWTSEARGEMCDGLIMHVERIKQIERVHAEGIETEFYAILPPVEEFLK